MRPGRAVRSSEGPDTLWAATPGLGPLPAAGALGPGEGAGAVPARGTSRRPGAIRLRGAPRLLKATLRIRGEWGRRGACAGPAVPAPRCPPSSPLLPPRPHRPLSHFSISPSAALAFQPPAAPDPGPPGRLERAWGSPSPTADGPLSGGRPCFPHSLSEKLAVKGGGFQSCSVTNTRGVLSPGLVSPAVKWRKEPLRPEIRWQRGGAKYPGEKPSFCLFTEDLLVPVACPLA